MHSKKSTGVAQGKLEKSLCKLLGDTKGFSNSKSIAISSFSVYLVTVDLNDWLQFYVAAIGLQVHNGPHIFAESCLITRLTERLGVIKSSNDSKNVDGSRVCGRFV